LMIAIAGRKRGENEAGRKLTKRRWNSEASGPNEHHKCNKEAAHSYIKTDSSPPCSDTVNLDESSNADRTDIRNFRLFTTNQ